MCFFFLSKDEDGFKKRKVRRLNSCDYKEIVINKGSTTTKCLADHILEPVF